MEQEDTQSEKLEKIIDIINDTQNERSAEQVEEIKIFLSNHYSYLKTILKKLEQSDLEKFIKQLRCQKYTKGQKIESHGICSTRLGIIMKGRVKIQSSNSGKKKQFHEKKMILKQGERVGAESMLLQKPNLYSLSVDSETLVLLEVNRQQFDRCVKQLESEKFETNLAFIKRCQLFKLITNDAILTMILYNSVKIQFDTGEIVYQQEQNCYAIYIVFQGKFQVQQRFQDDTNQQLNYSMLSNGDNEGISARNYGGQRGSIQSDQSSFFNNQTLLKLRVVEPCDIFGEEEIIEMKQRGCSVVCIQDCSQVFVVRPIVYNSCILKDEYIKKKLVEMVDQKQQEVKEKERQKKDSYQNLGFNRSRISSLTTTPKNFQTGIESKESQFAKLHKSIYNNQPQQKNSFINNSFSDSSNSSISPGSFRKSNDLALKLKLASNSQGIDSPKDLETFSGFIRYQESVQKDSNSLEQTQKLNQIRPFFKQTSLCTKNFNSIQQQQDSDSEYNCDSPFEPWSSTLEVNGKKIGENNLMSKIIIDSNSLIRQQTHQKINNMPQKADFQVGPYQAQNINFDTSKKRINISQQLGRRTKGSPLAINIKQSYTESSPNYNSSLQQPYLSERQKLFHSLSTCNSPALISSPITLTNKSLQFQPRLLTNNSSTSVKFNQQKVQTVFSTYKENISLIPLKDREQTIQQDISFKSQQKIIKDSLFETSQIFSKKNGMPVSTVNQKIRMKSQNQMRQHSCSNQKNIETNIDNQISQNKSSGSINRPAIIVPNSIPLQSPISNIFQTQLTLSSLQQLKQQNFPDKPFHIEKYTQQGRHNLPNLQQNDIRRRIIRNNSQPLIKMEQQQSKQQYIK